MGKCSKFGGFGPSGFFFFLDTPSLGSRSRSLCFPNCRCPGVGGSGFAKDDDDDAEEDADGEEEDATMNDFDETGAEPEASDDEEDEDEEDKEEDEDEDKPGQLSTTVLCSLTPGKVCRGDGSFRTSTA